MADIIEEQQRFVKLPQWDTSDAPRVETHHLECGCIIFGYAKCQEARLMWEPANAAYRSKNYEAYAMARRPLALHFFPDNEGEGD